MSPEFNPQEETWNPPMMPIDLQKAVASWSAKLFGDKRTSKATGQNHGSGLALHGATEEVGELAETIDDSDPHVTELFRAFARIHKFTICYHQHRRGFGSDPAGLEKYKANIKDALADIIIFLCDFSEQEGIDLFQNAVDTWEKVVSKRNLQNWEKVSHETPLPRDKETITVSDVGSLDDVLSQNGQGFAEPKEEAESKVLTYEQRSIYACGVCGVVPDESGSRQHSRGCYVVSSDGGGSDYIELGGS